MFKKFVSSILVLIILVGCSQSKSVDINTVSNKIIEYYDKTNLTSLEKSDIESLLYIDEGFIEEGIFYISNNNTSDMFAILKSKENDNLKTYIKDYIDIVKTQNTNYFPEEVSKLENALIFEKDGYVYLIVNDKQADIKKIIE